MPTNGDSTDSVLSRRGDGALPRVLVVDDEPNIKDLVAALVEQEGWVALRAADGRSAIESAAVDRPDAIVLDVMLPDLDGREVLRRVHAVDPDLPVLMLTARDSTEDRVSGLQAGADDYLVKPFDLDELALRIRRMLLRGGTVAPMADLVRSVGALDVDELRRVATINGTVLELGTDGFSLLSLLSGYVGRLLPVSRAIAELWPSEVGDLEHRLRRAVHELRQRLPSGCGVELVSVPGVGYGLKA